MGASTPRTHGSAPCRSPVSSRTLKTVICVSWGYGMNQSVKSRVLIWLGPVYAVLFLVVGLVLEGDAPGEKTSGEDVVAYFNGHQGRTLAEAFAGPLAAALLILFVSELRTRARARQDSGAPATAMVAGAVLLAGGILFGSAIDLGLASSADHDQPEVAQTLNVLGNADWIPFIGGIAVFLIGAGLTVLSSGLLPKWLGWVALVGGVVSLVGPGGFIGFFLAPLWILVAGIMLGVRGSSDSTGGPGAAVAGGHRTTVAN